MSNLPNAVYVAAVMATAGKTLVVISSGSAFGDYEHPRIPVIAADAFTQVAGGNARTLALPDGVYSAAVMATAGKTLVIVATGTCFGEYTHGRSVVIPTFVISGAAAENSPSGAEVSTGRVPTTGLVAEHCGSAATEVITGSQEFIQVTENTPVAIAQIDGYQEFIGLIENPIVATEAVTGSNNFRGLAEQSVPATESASGLTYMNIPAKPGVTQVLIEVAPHAEAGHGPPNTVVTQDAIEWVRHPPDHIFLSQTAIEYLFHPPDRIWGTQTCIEVAYKPLKFSVKARYKRFLPAQP